MRIIRIIPFLIFINGCQVEDKKHSSANEYKEGFYFNIEHSDEYDYDNLELFNPNLDYVLSEDTLKIEISYIESGGPKFEGKYFIKNDTLHVLLQDVEPDIAYTLEEYLTINFSIKLKNQNFKTIELNRKYTNRIKTDYFE